MSITCEKCGGQVLARGYGDCETYVRKLTCKSCGHVMYTQEEVVDRKTGSKLWYQFRVQTIKARREREGQA